MILHFKTDHLIHFAKVSPNILYNLKIPKEEQISGYLTDNTLNEIEEKVYGWEGGDSQSGLEHFLCVQTVADKTVADCVEALIGVYLTVSIFQMRDFLLSAATESLKNKL